jgi:hypothetical protein
MPDLNKSSVTDSMEPGQLIDESNSKFCGKLYFCLVARWRSCFIAASTPEEVPLSIAETEENDLAEGDDGEHEEEAPPEESAAVSGRSQRGLPRKAARRARGRRGGGAAARARVVSTRLHGGRRNAAVPASIDNDVNNATLEETVNTETEESPKKVAKTPDVEQKSTEPKLAVSAEAMSADEAAASSQTDAGSNVRVSGKAYCYIHERSLLRFF